MEEKSTYYPLLIRSEKYEKLLAIQSSPEQRYWLKDREVSLEQLVDILEKCEG